MRRSGAGRGRPGRRGAGRAEAPPAAPLGERPPGVAPRKARLPVPCPSAPSCRLAPWRPCPSPPWPFPEVLPLPCDAGLQWSCILCGARQWARIILDPNAIATGAPAWCPCAGPPRAESLTTPWVLPPEPFGSRATVPTARAEDAFSFALRALPHAASGRPPRHARPSGAELLPRAAMIHSLDPGPSLGRPALAGARPGTTWGARG